MSYVVRSLLALFLAVLLVHATPAPAVDSELPRKGYLGVRVMSEYSAELAFVHARAEER